MSMFNDIDWTALSSYLAGHCSAEETSAVERWIAAEPSRAGLIAELRTLWRIAGDLGPRYDVERALRQARTRRAAVRMAEETASDSAHPRRARRVPTLALHDGRTRRESRRAVWLARAAAALVLAAGAGGAIAWWSRAEPTAAGARTAATPIAMREVATKKGQRAEISLSDGTRVVLGVESRLRYASVTGATSREVFLDGEALFDVTHDDTRPFRVYTAAGVVEDLGTRFVVRAYQPDSAVRVIVASGRVALQPVATARSGKTPASAVTLGAGDLGEVRSGAVAVRRGVDPSTYLAWTRGQITFDRTPLEQVVRELERWYDVHIDLTEPRYGAVPVTASFQNQSADDVLSLLAGMLDMRYARQGAQVTLGPERRGR